ncbi:zinc finger FYVE domain-containing protein 21-like [Xenia sp. Carnegie-2017]|uniref:zinc finger FYVE domain-containing protein 21-like n=1 Tax=Xenia sp. Carnegie-2017 TaxID=2897299 RepID=UPI001F036EC6|nr:zinc finger FYVE domain-containing protein 21-like [Xenia sp. Carnegie-2017]
MQDRKLSKLCGNCRNVCRYLAATFRRSTNYKNLFTCCTHKKIKERMASGKSLARTKSGLRMLPNNEQDRSPFTIEEPPWQPDDQYNSCIKCKVVFDFWKRRHHCRRCGNLFCGSCCDQKVLLLRLNFVDPVRVCEECAIVARKENEFFNKSLKVLIHGANFYIGNSCDKSFHCQLNHKNHREIIIGKGEGVIDLTELVSVKTISENPETPGSTLPVVTGLIFKCKSERKNKIETVELRALEPSQNGRKASLNWIIAMQKGIKILFEAGN